MNEEIQGSESSWPRPVVVVSACLGFDACRYDGQRLRAGLLDALASHVEMLPVCPEVEIGLGTPRAPVRLVGSRDEARLVQPSTGRDVTPEMLSFAERFLDGLAEVDGFLLKSRSPSCGPKDVRVYGGSGAPSGRAGPGLFAAAAARRFPGVPLEDEGRLTNLHLRDHFLTRLFQSARLRALPESISALVRFHRDSKLLLMAHSEVGMRELGRIVANPDGSSVANTISRYRDAFMRALGRPPRRGPTVNALLHAFGHLSPALASDERRVFLSALRRFRLEQAGVDGPLELLRAWNARAGFAWLAGQTIFEPYPWALHTPAHSGGRARSA